MGISQNIVQVIRKEKAFTFLLRHFSPKVSNFYWRSIIGFCGGRKTGVPGEKPVELGRELTTNSTHIWCRAMNLWTRATLVGGDCSHHCAIPALPIQRYKWIIFHAVPAVQSSHSQIQWKKCLMFSPLRFFAWTLCWLQHKSERAKPLVPRGIHIGSFKSHE